MGSHWLTKAGAQLDQPPCVAPPAGPGPQHCGGCRQGPKGPGDGPGGIEGSRLGPIQLSLPVAQFKNCTVTRCPPETSGRDPGSHPHVPSIRRSHHSAPPNISQTCPLPTVSTATLLPLETALASSLPSTTRHSAATAPLPHLLYLRATESLPVLSCPVSSCCTDPSAVSSSRDSGDSALTQG